MILEFGFKISGTDNFMISGFLNLGSPSSIMSVYAWSSESDFIRFKLSFQCIWQTKMFWPKIYLITMFLNAFILKLTNKISLFIKEKSSHRMVCQK
jgi:hypothetical protein